MSGNRPVVGDDPRPVSIDTEFQVVTDLQVQATLFAVAEQFATLVRAARRHADGEEPFFDAYMKAPLQLVDLVRDIAEISREDVLRVVGDPEGHRPRRAPLVLMDPTTVETVDVGGIHVPREVIRSRAEHNLVDTASALVDLIVKNVRQLQQFVDAPPTVDAVAVASRPLREIDNAFRHAMRILFHECVPEPRRFRIGSVLADATDYSVDLYMPHRSGPEKILFGTISCTPERTNEHLVALRELSTRVGQVARGFLGRQLYGDARWLLAAAQLSLPVPRHAEDATDPPPPEMAG
ncbi:MAG: hypothetical protein U0V73_05620 [Acidimicrobiia bacterium]